MRFRTCRRHGHLTLRQKVAPGSANKRLTVKCGIQRQTVGVKHQGSNMERKLDASPFKTVRGVTIEYPATEKNNFNFTPPTHGIQSNSHMPCRCYRTIGYTLRHMRTLVLADRPGKFVLDDRPGKLLERPKVSPTDLEN